MFEAVQNFDVINENSTNRKMEKLQLVKLVFLAMTLGFTLTVTVLVSEDKSLLSKLACASEPNFPIMSGSRFCGNEGRFNLSLGLYATSCRRKEDFLLILNQIGYENKIKTEISLNSEQWALLKLEVNKRDATFLKSKKMENVN